MGNKKAVKIVKDAAEIVPRIHTTITLLINTDKSSMDGSRPDWD